MADKPTTYVDWTESSATTLSLDNTLYRVEPGVSKKLTGYLFEEKPVYEHWNWAMWNVGRWTRWLSSLFSGYYQIGAGVVDYGDVNTAMADSSKFLYLANDSTLVNQTFNLSDGFLKTSGAKITNTSAPGGSILEISGSNNDVEVIIDNKNTMTDGLLVSGNGNRVHVKIFNSGAFTLTNAVHLTGNYNTVDAIVVKTAGTITNPIVDAGTDNNYTVTYSI